MPLVLPIHIWNSCESSLDDSIFSFAYATVHGALCIAPGAEPVFDIVVGEPGYSPCREEFYEYLLTLLIPVRSLTRFKFNNIGTNCSFFHS